MPGDRNNGPIFVNLGSYVNYICVILKTKLGSAARAWISSNLTGSLRVQSLLKYSFFPWLASHYSDVIVTCFYYEYSHKSVLSHSYKSTKPCSFIEHAVCVSTIMDQFRIPKSKCLPACISHTFAPKSIQYVKTSQKRVELMRSVLNLTNDIDTLGLTNWSFSHILYLRFMLCENTTRQKTS